MSDEEEEVDDSIRNRLRDQETKRVLYWTRRLCLTSDEVRKLSPLELQCRLLLLEQTEQAQKHRLEQFKRWQKVYELRYFMYKVQRDFNEKHGKDAIGVSIWRILSMEQQKLEKELNLDDIRGDIKRFPSPMSVMVPECEPEEILKPLIPVLSGFSHNLNRNDVQQSCNSRERVPTTLADILYEREKEKYLMKMSAEYDEEDLKEEEVEKVQTLQCSSSETESSSQTCDYNLQEDFDIHVELENIKQSTARCDSIMEALFAPYPEQSSQESEAEQMNCELDYIHGTSDCQCGISDY